MGQTCAFSSVPIIASATPLQGLKRARNGHSPQRTTNCLRKSECKRRLCGTKCAFVAAVPKSAFREARPNRSSWPVIGTIRSWHVLRNDNDSFETRAGIRLEARECLSVDPGLQCRANRTASECRPNKTARVVKPSNGAPVPTAPITSGPNT